MVRIANQRNAVFLEKQDSKEDKNFINEIQHTL